MSRLALVLLTGALVLGARAAWKAARSAAVDLVAEGVDRSIYGTTSEFVDMEFDADFPPLEAHNLN